MCNATCAGAALMTWRASLQRPRCDNLLSSPSVMPRSISTAHAASRARDRDAEPRGRSGRLRGAVAEAPSTPSPPASRLRHRTSSTENLVNAARLVRSESQKQLLQHAQLLATGDYPWQVEFSAVVAASSLLYAGVAATYFAHSWHRFGSLFVLVTLCSLSADSLAPTNKYLCCLDRLMATVSTFLSPIRVVVTPGLACLQVRLMVCFLLVFSLSFLAWSRNSKSMADFRTRHVMWHIVSAAALAWLADVEGTARHQVPLQLGPLSLLARS